MLAQGATRLSYADGVLHLGDELALPMERDGTVLLPFSNDESGRGGRGALQARDPRVAAVGERRRRRAGARASAPRQRAQGPHRHLRRRARRRAQRADAGGAHEPRGALRAGGRAPAAPHHHHPRAGLQTDAWLTVVFAFVGATLAMAWSLVVRRPGWLAWVATICPHGGAAGDGGAADLRGAAPLGGDGRAPARRRADLPGVARLRAGARAGPARVHGAGAGRRGAGRRLPAGGARTCC